MSSKIEAFMVQSLTLRVAEMIFWRDTDLRFGKSMEFVEILGNSWICDLGILGKSINSLFFLEFR